MNKLFKIFTLFAFFAMMFASCSPDEYGLGKKDVKPEDLVEGIAFKIEHDAVNPNIVYLTSLMDSQYTVLWNHPQGRSQAQQVTLKMPFPGTYKVQFGVETRGGIVYGDTVTFDIKDFYADFVNDEQWILLTGGVGKSKTWIHDNGSYGLASGEMDYADPATVVEYNNFTPNWSPGKGHTGDDNIWNSTMTFSLDGGAFVNVHNAAAGGNVDQSGTFMINTDNHTLTLTDAQIMHTQGWTSKTTNWNTDLRILRLTENQLQVAVFREKISGESEWWMIWNYVSKEYADNYVPEADPIPEIGGNPNEILTTTNSKTWILSPDSPYDWADLKGGLLNNFANKEAYLSSGWAAYDADMIAATKFTFTSTSGTGGTFKFSSFDNEDVEGGYTIDANNDIDFGQSLSAVISRTDFGWISTMSLKTTEENKLRILKTKTDALGTISDMWLGQRSSEKSEYMVFHFVLGSGGTTDVDAVVKKKLCAHTWKLDMAGTKFGGPLTYAKPPGFPELTDAWTPVLAENTWLMINGDHGSMKFNQDGTVNITQKTVVDGAFDKTNNISGTWAYDGATYKLTLNIPILHADNFTSVVKNWGDSRLQSIGDDYLRLCVVRDAELSGEDEWFFIYNYIPAD